MQKGLKVADFVLNELIGKGGFGEVWAATSLIDHKLVAVKVEPLNSSRKILEEESRVMLKLTDSLCFPQYIKYWEEGNTAFLAMELLQSTIKQTTEAAFGGRLSLKQGASLGIQMLTTVRSLHEHGYIHRDIKPSNFMYRPGNSPPDVCLIDFGMAKMWRNAEGYPIPARYGVGFRGTSRYASLNSHDGSDLSCRDDLWSFLYILVEMVAPPLPWHNQSSRDIVAQVKRRSASRLVVGLPAQFQELVDYVTKLKFSESPNYDFLMQKLQEIKDIGEMDDSRHFAINVNTNFGDLGKIAFENGDVGNCIDESSSSVACSECDAPLFTRSFSKGAINKESVVVEKKSIDPERFCCCCLLI